VDVLDVLDDAANELSEERENLVGRRAELRLERLDRAALQAEREEDGGLYGREAELGAEALARVGTRSRMTW
jgi:hypothetical protein